LGSEINVKGSGRNVFGRDTQALHLSARTESILKIFNLNKTVTFVTLPFCMLSESSEDGSIKWQWMVRQCPHLPKIALLEIPE
jgi:hypothetical protein